MKPKLIILIATPLYPPEIGGPATYTKFLEEHIPKGDFELDKVWFGEVKHLPYIIRHIALFWKILKKSKNADIVYALDPLGVGLPAMFAAKLRGKRFFLRIAGDRAWETAIQKFNIGESLDTFSASWNYVLPIRILKYGQTLCAKMAEKIIVPSEYLKSIVTSWGIPKGKISVIYNSFEPIKISETKKELREKFHLSGTVFMSAGRLVPWKGFVMLIKMMQHFPNATLYIIGDGPQKEFLKKIANDRIVFLGIIPKRELLERIKAADVFLLNTFYEGFSHQLLEAMSVGTPVVTTRVGGNPELIESGKNGFLVEYNDEQALRAVLKDNLLTKVAENARERIQRFSAERAVSSFITAISN